MPLSSGLSADVACRSPGDRAAVSIARGSVDVKVAHAEPSGCECVAANSAQRAWQKAPRRSAKWRPSSESCASRLTTTALEPLEPPIRRSACASDGAPTPSRTGVASPPSAGSGGLTSALCGSAPTDESSVASREKKLPCASGETMGVAPRRGDDVSDLDASSQCAARTSQIGLLPTWMPIMYGTSDLAIRP